jgi:hypothetical protein
VEPPPALHRNGTDQYALKRRDGGNWKEIRLPAVVYSKALEYKYRVKTAALGTLK